MVSQTGELGPCVDWSVMCQVGRQVGEGEGGGILETPYDRAGQCHHVVVVVVVVLVVVLLLKFFCSFFFLLSSLLLLLLQA